MSLRTKPRAAVVHARSLARRVGSAARDGAGLPRLARRSGRPRRLPRVAAPPPAGGGHQFLRALTGELRDRGLEVEENRLSGATPRCLFNSFNFDLARMRRFARDDVRMVHRVDGPIGVYRGFDDGTDRRIEAMNAELAHATVLQSRFSLDAHRELGIRLVEPVVIRNAPDPAIFHPPNEREDVAGRPLRVVAVSWSDNPRKGADVLTALGAVADPERFELTFVGRAPEGLVGWRVARTSSFGGARRAAAKPGLLRRGEPRRPVLERAPRGPRLRAACRVPPQRRPPRARGRGGHRLRRARDVAAALAQLGAELDERRAAIVVPSLAAGRRPVPRGASRMSACADRAEAGDGGPWHGAPPAHARVAGTVAALRPRRRARLGARRRGGVRRGGRPWRRLPRRRAVVGPVLPPTGRLPHESLRGARSALDGLVAPARARLLPRSARRRPGYPEFDRALESLRTRSRPLRAGPGDPSRDGAARRRGRRRPRPGAPDPDRDRARPVPARGRRAPSRRARLPRPRAGRVRGGLVPEGRGRDGRRRRAEDDQGSGRPRRRPRARARRARPARRAAHGPGTRLRARASSSVAACRSCTACCPTATA